MPSATKNREKPKSAIDRLVKAAAEGEVDNYAGKRRCFRFADGVPLEITTDPQQEAEWKAVYMHNVSAGGCAFWSKRPLEVRSVVWVRQFTDDEPQPWLRAKVSHRTIGIRGFLIGVAFESEESGS